MRACRGLLYRESPSHGGGRAPHGIKKGHPKQNANYFGIAPGTASYWGGDPVDYGLVGSRFEPDSRRPYVSPLFLARFPAKLGQLLASFDADPESKIRMVSPFGKEQFHG